MTPPGKPMTDPELLQSLQQQFGHPDFREGQAEVIRRVLSGQDCLAVMPTGGGKSLCYQLPALLHDGVTLVISPLIALMKDQVDALTERGIAATYINSSLASAEREDRLQGLASGRYRLVYVAPERFRSPRFLAALRAVRVWLFAVDEAHCVSMWGHDFRPDYLQLAHGLDALDQPQVLALTATATPEVREDISTQLGLGHAPRQDAAVVVRGFARPGLTLAVARVAGRADKFARLHQLLEEHPTAIVYCATRRNVETVATELAAQGRRCAAYHAGLPDEVRRDVQERFVSGALDVVAATNAFGMGIDRADVRAIVHWDVPGSLESYYQEAGRAGRDGEPARCELLFNQADVRTQEFFIEGGNPPVPLVRGILQDVWEAGPEGVTEAAIVARVSEGRRVNEMAVGSALRTLERWGAVARGAEGSESWIPGGRDDVPTLEQEAGLQEKARRDRARLHRLLRYVRSAGCRHATILRYFGDPHADGICRDRCDRCLAGSPDAPVTGRSPTEPEWERIQKALSAVARLRGRFGQTRVAQVLAGSRDRNVLQAGLDRLPSHGSLRGMKQGQIRGLLNDLEDVGCLETVGTDYPTVQLTAIGVQVMRREAALTVPWPAPAPPAPRRPRTRKRAAVDLDEGPVDEALFEALRGWRLEQARQRGVPAYVVFTDAALRGIAQARPTDEPALLAVKGVGPAKMEAYGDEVLALVRQW